MLYSSTGEAVSATAVFGEDKYYDFETLYGLDLSLYANPTTGELPHFWHNPQVVEKKLSHLAENGQLAFIRNAETQKIDAFTYGYQDAIEAAFGNEEWQNPNAYSGVENPEQLRDLDHFVDCISKTLGMELSATSQVYIWNQFGVMPNARRKGYMKKVSKALALKLKTKEDLPEIGLLEVEKGSLTHKLFTKMGASDVPGALDLPDQDDPHSITLMTFSVEAFIDYFLEG